MGRLGTRQSPVYQLGVLDSAYRRAMAGLLEQRMDEPDDE
jgi:ribosomal protein S16